MRYGEIAPPDLIVESSFISRIDYHYPRPEGPFGVSVHTGHRQVSLSGQEEFVVIGLQGQEIPFEDLPPMNIAFVIDKSGSMAGEKLEWVKESFEIFVRQVRPQDIVSLVVFDSAAYVIFPSVAMRGKRDQFRQAVRMISSGGGTNLTAGLQLGYEQVMANFRHEYSNRVLFLTDGVGASEGMFEMAETYRSMGVNVSTIGLGKNFDLDLMSELARRGGGSSRFISDRETMVEAFGEGLGRMAVPVAKDVSVEVELMGGTHMIDTWAYSHQTAGNKEIYTFPAVHLGDYETIVMRLDLPEFSTPGPVTIGRILTNYTDSEGEENAFSSMDIIVEAAALENPVDGISDATVLRAGTMVNYATCLKEIGSEYHESKQITGQERSAIIEQLLQKTNSMKKEVLNARQRLDYDGFEDELAILDKYLHILGGEINLSDGVIEDLWNDREIAPFTEDRSLLTRIGSLFQEMIIEIRSRQSGTIAVSGFAVNDSREAGICDLLDEMAESTFAEEFTVVERRQLNKVMEEQKLVLSDLVETTTAIDVGKLVAAEYILTGTIIPMQSSIVIFTRIIHVESSVVESVAQIIVPIDDEVRGML